MNQGMPQMGKGQQFAGLGALGQPATMPKGKPVQAMNDIMAMARKMSDAQLAEVLAGKSMDIPQFAAMTEAMGRKKLRTAMQGAQAMQQASQPTVKDRLAAETMQTAGIDQLPAPNMGTVDMASGGIVAFSDGGDTIDPYGTMDSAALAEDQARVESVLNRRQREQEKERYEFLKQNAPDVAAKMLQENPTLEASKKETPKQAAVPTPTPTRTETPVPGVAPRPAERPVSAGVGSSGMGSYDDLLKRRTTDYLSKLEGLSNKQRESLAEIKKQGMGEGLMQLAAGLLSAPNLSQGLAKGMPLLAASAAATRKEARAVENMANEYDMNLAKAREAAERGDMALALQYQQLANQNKYQMGMLDVYGQRNAIMKDQYNESKIPGQLGKLYADATKEVKDKYGGIVPPSKQKQYAADIEAAYRKRATAVGLGKYVDLYSPGSSTSNFNVVQSLPKGAKVIDPFAQD